MSITFHTLPASQRDLVDKRPIKGSEILIVTKFTQADRLTAIAIPADRIKGSDQGVRDLERNDDAGSKPVTSSNLSRSLTP
jgi:hypothetical protein